MKSVSETKRAICRICIEKRIAYGCGSWMIWGAISMGARTDLVFIRGDESGHGREGLADARYIEEILALHVVPYVDYIGGNFFYAWQCEGAHRKNRARLHHKSRISAYLVASMQFRSKPDQSLFMGWAKTKNSC